MPSNVELDACSSLGATKGCCKKLEHGSTHCCERLIRYKTASPLGIHRESREKSPTSSDQDCDGHPSQGRASKYTWLLVLALPPDSARRGAHSTQLSSEEFGKLVPRHGRRTDRTAAQQQLQ